MKVSGQSSAMHNTKEYTLQRVLSICPICDGERFTTWEAHVNRKCKNRMKPIDCPKKCFSTVQVPCPHCEDIIAIFYER
jgi:hypothetical protein